VFFFVSSSRLLVHSSILNVEVTLDKVKLKDAILCMRFVLGAFQTFTVISEYFEVVNR
jgi:hypothetical protein